MGQFRGLLSWYRLKSNDKHLFLKISGTGYLEIQPETEADAEALAQETIEACRDLRDIARQDNRTLWIKLDLRGFDMTQVRPILLVKYVSKALSQGLDIEHTDVYGSGPWFQYFFSFLPKHVQSTLDFK